MRALLSASLVMILLVTSLSPAPASSTVTACLDGLGLAAPGDGTLRADCDDERIRPGTASSGCTLNFLLSDGTDFYFLVAGHCGGVGKRWKAHGITFGTTIYQRWSSGSDITLAELLELEDWALIRVDAEDRDRVDGTMTKWGGPLAPGGFDARPPIVGEAVVQYGHGRGMGKEDGTKGRVSQVAALLGTTAFVYAGEVGPGDSGSPVRFVAGQPAGIAVIGAGIVPTWTPEGFAPRCTVAILCDALIDACGRLDGTCDGAFRSDGIYGAVVVTRYDAAMADIEAATGLDLQLIEGAPASLSAVEIVPVA